MSFPALAVACMATQQLPPWEEDELDPLYEQADGVLLVEWVIYESEGAGRLLRVRRVEWE